jgi:hypothetical protein
MTNLWDNLVYWVKEKFKGKDQRLAAAPRFKLTRETLDQVMIYGGVEWKDDDGIRQELQLCKDKEERDRLVLATKLNREFVETERNRERLAQTWHMLRPEQIQEIEDKINRGERLEAIDAKKYFSAAKEVQPELEY